MLPSWFVLITETDANYFMMMFLYFSAVKSSVDLSDFDITFEEIWNLKNMLHPIKILTN